MDLITVYAITVAAAFLVLFVSNIRPYVDWFATQYLVYPRLIPRSRFFGPWSLLDIFSYSIYAAVNLFCACFRVADVQASALRAAHLSLINMIFLFAGPHLSFIADILGITLATYKKIHRFVGIMVFALLVFHILTIIVVNASVSTVMENLWAVIGSSLLCILMLMTLPLFRNLSYEAFLRTHQIMAVLFIYSVWSHLRLSPVKTRIYLYIPVGMFASMFIFQCLYLAYRNRAFLSGHTKADITISNNTIRIRLKLSRPLRVQPGQYICLWIPGISFWSFLQSHPFTVTSWSDTAQESLDLFIEPCDGLTQKFLHYNRLSYLALFSGPHGQSVPVGNYDTILMVASGFGIAPMLPYLSQLINGYNARPRRVHLVWQIDTIDIGVAVQSLLNKVLKTDTAHNGYILSISIYVQSKTICQDEVRITSKRESYDNLHRKRSIDSQKTLVNETSVDYQYDITSKRESNDNLRRKRSIDSQKTLVNETSVDYQYDITSKRESNDNLRRKRSIDSQKTLVNETSIDHQHGIIAENDLCSGCHDWMWIEFGKRAVLINGSANLHRIFREEKEGKHLQSAANEVQGRGRMLVMVSSVESLRDTLRNLVGRSYDQNIRFHELEYQPSLTQHKAKNAQSGNLARPREHIGHRKNDGPAYPDPCLKNGHHRDCPQAGKNPLQNIETPLKEGEQTLRKCR